MSGASRCRADSHPLARADSQPPLRGVHDPDGHTGNLRLEPRAHGRRNEDYEAEICGSTAELALGRAPWEAENASEQRPVSSSDHDYGATPCAALLAGLCPDTNAAALANLPSDTQGLARWCAGKDEQTVALLRAASQAISALLARADRAEPVDELQSTLREAMGNDMTANDSDIYSGLAALVTAIQKTAAPAVPDPPAPDPSAPEHIEPPQDTPPAPRVVELLHIEPEESRPPTFFSDTCTTESGDIHVDRYGFVYGMSAAAYKNHIRDPEVRRASDSSVGTLPDAVEMPTQTDVHDTARGVLTVIPTRATTGASMLSVSHSVRSDAQPSLSVQRLLQHMHNIYDQQQSERKKLWDAFLSRHSEHGSPTCISGALPERGDEDWAAFHRLCQSGVPMAYRPAVWSACIGAADVAEPGQYPELCAGNIDAQIELDVRRTMPTNLFFGGDGPGVPKLRRVLTAYSHYDPVSGYCQGMNNLAAVLLLTYANEEEAFWAFAGIVRKILPHEYYGADMAVVHADQQVLVDLVRSGLPKLHAHMQALGVELRAVTIGWFLSLFTTCLPIETLLRLWDVFFVEGSVMLFRIAFSVLSLKVHQLLATTSESGFYARLHMLAAHMFDADEIIQVRTTLTDVQFVANDDQARRDHVAAPQAHHRYVNVRTQAH